MKRAFIAPLCSALIIPGLGQIVNQEIKKGLLLLGAVFLLFVAGSVKLVFVLKTMVDQSDSGSPVPSTVLGQLDSLVMVGAFFVIWLYSVVDAFLKAREKER